MDWDATRAGELEVALPEPSDARLIFIGHIETPFKTRDDCPRQGKHDGPECFVAVDPPFRPALKGLENYAQAEILCWMHQARRDLLLQAPKSDAVTFGTFALRSPVRPNPIATAVVQIVAVRADGLVVRGLDCVSGTPLLDIKPERCAFTPKAPANVGVEG